MAETQIAERPNSYSGQAVRVFLVALSIFAVPLGASGKQHRGREVTREFQREHACPSTGKRYGACPGYIRDHVIALCVGGADSPTNMQWQTITDAKAKDKTECRLRRR